MANQIKTTGLVFVTILFISIITVLGINLFLEKKYQGTLQSVVENSLYDARDDSARVEKGIFILNTKKFEEDLENSDIVEFDSGVQGDLEKTQIVCKYLEDDNATISVGEPDKVIKAVKVIATAKVKNKNEYKKHVSTLIISKSTAQKNDDLSD